MLTTEYAMTYLLEIDGPAAPRGDEAPSDRRTFWSMVHATLAGPRIRAESPYPGIDWFTPDKNGFGRPHVRLPFVSDDGAVILLDYRGIVQATKIFNCAVDQDSETGWDDQYMRMTLYFETEAPAYRWLMDSVFIARGRLRGAKTIEYEVYRLL